MRLIDVELLMENLGFENTEQEREENTGEVITLEDFDRIPTAYDVEKVIEELKAHAVELEAFGSYSGYVELSRAIEIVKGGGMDE